MIVLYCVLGLIGLILLLLCIPIGFTVERTEKTYVKLRVLGIPFTVTSPKKKEQSQPKTVTHKPKKNSQNKETKPSVFGELKQTLQQGGSVGALTWLSEVVGVLHRATKRVVRAIVIRKLVVRRDIVGDDAAQTALIYGRTCAIVYPLLGTLGSLLNVRKQSVEVVPQFAGKESRTTVYIGGHICPLRVVWAALCGFFSFIRINVAGKIEG